MNVVVFTLLQVVNMIKPIAAVKKLSTTLSLALDVPIHAVGDAKRLTQIMLNVAGNAVKFTKEGQISIEASVAKPDYIRGSRQGEFYPPSTEGHFYLRMQVEYSFSLSPEKKKVIGLNMAIRLSCISKQCLWKLSVSKCQAES